MVAEAVAVGTYVPIEPMSLKEAGLTDSEVEGLILKFLAARGDASGWTISDQIKLPYRLVVNCLNQLKDARLIGYRGSAGVNDFLYQITDHGRDTARRLAHQSTYFGAAPVSLEDYKAHGGLKGLRTAIAMVPADVVKQVTDSGLRGRGGAGFPTGIKWKTVLDAAGPQKYIVCNADEGDSGTFADRMIMEGDPFVVI